MCNKKISNFIITNQSVEDNLTRKMSSLVIRENDLSVHNSTQKNYRNQNNNNTIQPESCSGTKVSENEITNDLNQKYLVDQQLCEDYQPTTVNETNSKKQKQSTKRMKLKEHTIIANEKVIARQPAYYKFDRSTTLLLKTLFNQQHSGEFHNIVGKGTQSIVIHAHCYGNYHIYFPNGNAVKVCKLTNDLEKNSSIYKKVQREYDCLNVLRTQHFSNNTPHPVYKDKNIIIMSFVGSEQESALSISNLTDEKLLEAYNAIVKEIDTWYNKVGLVHGALSSSKILWMDRLYFIGWSHSVKIDHPMALKKLMRDCQFVYTFFKSRNVTVKSTEELFKDITGLEKISCKVLQVVNKDLWKYGVLNPNRKSVHESKATCDRFK